MDGPKRRASLRSIKLIVPAAMLLVALLALAGQAAFASIGNQSVNSEILPDVYFTSPVPNVNPSAPNQSCIIGIFGGPDDIALEHEWWLRYRGTGPQTVELNVWAASVNSSETGEIVVDFVDDSGPQSLTVAHPSTGETMGTLTLSVTGGQRYPFTVSKNSDAGVAHHYRLGTYDRIAELGWGAISDHLHYLEPGRNDWAIHASPQPEEDADVLISIMVDSTGASQVPNQAQNITYALVDAGTMADVIPETTQAISSGSGINIAFSNPSEIPTFILKIDGDGHYRMQNQTGTDWGFYLLPCPDQGEHHGNPRLVLVEPEDPHTDIGRMPIVLENVGDEAVIDFRILPDDGLNNIYAGEFHFVIEGPLEVLDARLDLPGVNLDTQGEGLAPSGLEELNLSDISVSPDEWDDNIDTAQIYVSVNEVRWEGDAQVGDFTFTLLGDPRPGEPLHRTEPFSGDEWGGISLARMHVRATDKGTANVFMVSPGGDRIPVLMVPIDEHGDPVIDPPQIDFNEPAGVVEIDPLYVRVKLQGSRTEDHQWEVPLSVAFVEPGTEDLVAEFGCERTRRDGSWAVCNIDDAPEGFFDVYVTSSGTLVHVKENVEIDKFVDFENPLREGDLNEDGRINAQDFSLWLDFWENQTDPCPPHDVFDYSPGDFDKNCSVNVLDFSIFLENWREESPQVE